MSKASREVQSVERLQVGESAGVKHELWRIRGQATGASWRIHTLRTDGVPLG